MLALLSGSFLIQNSVLSADEIKTFRLEADRLLRLCTDESERYAKRIEWEVDHLKEGERAGMEKIIRKLEPISDMSPLFSELATIPDQSPIRRVFGEPVELFEDKLTKLRGSPR
jgi:hypothetical protein